MKIGVAFSDHIKSARAHKRKENAESSFRMRSYILPFILFTFPLIILLKLFDIQIVHGNYYRNISDHNRTKTNILFPQRGVVLDRFGVPLIINSPDFEINDRAENAGLSREEAIKIISENKANLQIDSLRYYPFREVLAHVLGYVGKISEDELSQLAEPSLYDPSDFIGKSGVEKEYDKILRGIYGKELVEVDAMGNKIRALGTQDPIDGENITLTLDLNLQKAAYESLPNDKKGAVIVTKPNGEILSIVSKPSFDPNIFTLGEKYVSKESSYPNISSILSDNENQPLLDRAISGEYPPGSTFKLITAASGLEQKVIDSKFTVEDTGVIRVGEFSFGNWYFIEQGRKDGVVNVVKGIARSNDIFFYKLAEKISVDKLSETASGFGVGKKSGIDLPGEKTGLLPTKKWKSIFIKESWYLGDTYHYGIGQGYLLTTPLQVNMWTAVLANNGVLPKPHLLISDKQKVASKILSDSNIDLIRKGMIDSCRPGGVAWPLFEFRIQNSKLRIDGKNILAVPVASSTAKLKDMREVVIACKTGTAQHGGEDTLPHAWITLFAPAYNPEIVVTVLVEEAGQGSNVAAPVAKKILEEYFKAKL